MIIMFSFFYKICEQMFNIVLTANIYSDILCLQQKNKCLKKGRKERSDMRTENRSNNRKRKYRIKSKFRFITSLIVMIGILVGGINYILGLDTSFALIKSEPIEVEVCYGDTLWEIANTYKDDNTDTRRAIFEICKVNDMSASDLEPGMVILVPDNL